MALAGRRAGGSRHAAATPVPTSTPLQTKRGSRNSSAHIPVRTIQYGLRAANMALSVTVEWRSVFNTVRPAGCEPGKGPRRGKRRRAVRTIQYELRAANTAPTVNVAWRSPYNTVRTAGSELRTPTLETFSPPRSSRRWLGRGRGVARSRRRRRTCLRAGLGNSFLSGRDLFAGGWNEFSKFLQKVSPNPNPAKN